MNPIPNPDSWMDVFTILMVSAIVAVPSWLAARNHKVVRAIKDQVVNGHSTPMREDIDLLRGEIAGLRDEVRGGFAAMRGDIGEERATRRAEDAAIRDQIAQREHG